MNECFNIHNNNIFLDLDDEECAFSELVQTLLEAGETKERIAETYGITVMELEEYLY